MKIRFIIKYISTAIIAMYCTAIIGQITVTNSTFPEAGDILFTILDTESNISIGDAGEDVIWDYRSLTGPFVRETRFFEASEGMSSEDFPEADLVSLSANEEEIYYKSFSNKIIEIGRAGEFVSGFDIPVVYEENPTFRRAPISFGDVDDDESIASVDIGADIIPAELLEGVPFEFDSVRISLINNSESEVEAWGTVRLPDGDYDVIRDKISNTADTKLFAKLPIIGWFDVTSLIGDIDELGDAIGVVETITYNYYSEEDKEIIVSIITDDQDMITSVEYKGDAILSDTKVVTPDYSMITAYPNPSFGSVSVQMVNYPLGEYRIKVYNVVGKELWTESYQLRSNRVFKADLMHLRKGTYLYSIFDKNGKKLVTKRIAIISI